MIKFEEILGKTDQTSENEELKDALYTALTAGDCIIDVLGTLDYDGPGADDDHQEDCALKDLKGFRDDIAYAVALLNHRIKEFENAS